MIKVITNPLDLSCKPFRAHVLMSYKTGTYETRCQPVTTKNLSDLLTSKKLSPQTECLTTLMEKFGPDDERVHRAKLKLPCILPSVAINGEQKECRITGDYQYFGVVQIDIDTKDNPSSTKQEMAAIKRTFSLHPSALYAYISPRGGVKAGFVTNTAKHLHAHTARLLITAIKQRFGVTCDQATTSLYQGSILCHDPNAWVADTPQVMLIKDFARLRLPKPRTSIRPRSDEKEQSVTNILNKTPRELSWHERRLINFRCLEIAGEAAIPLLVEHWDCDDQKKLARDVKSQLGYISRNSKR